MTLSRKFGSLDLVHRGNSVLFVLQSGLSQPSLLLTWPEKSTCSMCLAKEHFTPSQACAVSSWTPLWPRCCCHLQWLHSIIWPLNSVYPQMTFTDVTSSMDYFQTSCQQWSFLTLILLYMTFSRFLLYVHLMHSITIYVSVHLLCSI